MPAGRPSSYSTEKAVRICELISNGKTLKKICREDGMPDKATIFRWLAVNEEFRDLYAKAKEIQAELMAEEILEIADDGINDTYTDDEGQERVNADVIQRSRLRVDSRKWLLSKLMPKKYGEKLELAGNKDAPLTVQVVRLGEEAK